MHLLQKSGQPVTFTIEVDFLGTGTWVTYDVIEVTTDGYAHHEFPDGFSAHWVRVKPDRNCRATVYFYYN